MSAHLLTTVSRRTALGLAVASSTGWSISNAVSAAPSDKTQFVLSCMTLPYRDFSFDRALQGIKKSGYSHVAWGTTHITNGTKTPLLPDDASPKIAAQMGRRCRDIGLEPVMMFSMIYPEHPRAPKVLAQRLRQAHAAGVGQVLTFGHTKGGNRKLWIERLRDLAPLAAELDVKLVVKQHGGETGTGAACAAITREVDSSHIKVNYDAGNVMDYLNVDPLPDIAKCADEVHSFCIKDHRNWPRDQDCGPGLGEIDHYRLLSAVANLGRKIPLCCENIFAPLVPRPKTADEIDALAKRARIFLELVVAGIGAEQLP